MLGSRSATSSTYAMKNAPRYEIIHSHGVFEHFTIPQIRAALAQQVACANHVVFSVPSVFYPFEPWFGNERLMPLEEWERILSPFSIDDLRYYGDPKLGGQEQILCTLRGQPVDEDLIALMHPPAEPYKEDISAIVHTRNEATRISECLQTLVGWTDEIIVCDMESTAHATPSASTLQDSGPRCRILPASPAIPTCQSAWESEPVFSV